jgi:hypothetical protein
MPVGHRSKTHVSRRRVSCELCGMMEMPEVDVGPTGGVMGANEFRESSHRWAGVSCARTDKE